MFLGGRVDDALSTYHRHLLAYGQRSGSTSSTTPTATTGRASWPPNRPNGACLGRRARRTARVHLGLRRSRSRSATAAADRAPVAVQRESTTRSRPAWSGRPGLPRLETLRPGGDRSELVTAIVDYKVKNTLHTQAKADRDPQARLYLAGRWLTGEPAEHFSFAQIGKPGALAQDHDREPGHHTTRARPAARHARPDRPAANQIDASTVASGPTSRGDSPTPPAGSARRATAPTTPPAPAAADCSARLRGDDLMDAGPAEGLRGQRTSPAAQSLQLVQPLRERRSESRIGDCSLLSEMSLQLRSCWSSRASVRPGSPETTASTEAAAFRSIGLIRAHAQLHGTR